MEDPGKHPLIIAHKSLAEVIIYKTEFDALNWAPPKNIDQSKILRVAHNIEKHQFRKYLSESQIQEVKPLIINYKLIQEDVWQNFLDSINTNNDTTLINAIKQNNNPMVVKPYYLQKQ